MLLFQQRHYEAIAMRRLSKLSLILLAIWASVAAAGILTGQIKFEPAALNQYRAKASASLDLHPISCC